MGANFAVFLFGIFIGRAGWFMTLPFMAIYLSRTLGADPVAIGLVLGVGPLVACIAGFLAGSLTDRFSARTMILGGTLGSIVVFMLYCISSSLVIYGILNVFLGIFRSFIETSSQAYIAHLLPADQRTKGFSLRYMVINLSAAIGPLIGARMIFWSPQALFSLTALAYFLTFIVFCFVVKSYESNNHTGYWDGLRISTRILLRDKIAISIFLIQSFLCFAFAQTETTLPQMMAERGIYHYVHVYSWLLVINALMIVLLQLPLARLVAKYPLNKTAYLSVTLFVIAFVGFAFAQHAQLFILATVLFTLGEIASVTLCNIVIDKIAPLDMKGVYFGIISLGMVGFSLGTLVGGAVLKYLGGTVLFSGVAILAVLCFVSLLTRVRHPVLHDKLILSDNKT